MLNFLNYNTILSNYVFLNKSIYFLKKKLNKDIYFLISITKLNFISIYFKLSFVFYSTNLLEYFAYNIFNNKNIFNKNIFNKNFPNIIVKNFYILKKNLNVFLFSLKDNTNMSIRKLKHYYKDVILSDENIFYVSI